MVSNEESVTIKGKIFTLVNIINHAMILLVTGYLLYLSGWELNVTSVHVGLCTVGYVLLMSEGLMVLTSENVWSRQLKSYKTRSHVHWCLQMLGAAFSIAGTIVIYVVKERHFTSIHGILGITSVAIMIFLGFSGASVFYAYQMRRFIRPIAVKGFHNFLGIACFVIGIVSQCYGYKKKWMVRKTGEEIATVCIVLTSIITLISLYRPIVSFYRQVTTLLSRG